jgi:hypothetical protein
VLEAESDNKVLLFHAKNEIFKMRTKDTIANAVYTALS